MMDVRPVVCGVAPHRKCDDPGVELQESNVLPINRTAVRAAVT